MVRLLVLTVFVVQSCAPLLPTAPTPAGWRVDVVNGPRRVIVSIATDRQAAMWFVDPGARVNLLDWPEARPGGIELIEITADGCVLLDSVLFPAENFTIVLNGAAIGSYTITVEPGASTTGPPGVEATTSCSG
jgi:hypothetical protein